MSPNVDQTQPRGKEKHCRDLLLSLVIRIAVCRFPEPCKIERVSVSRAVKPRGRMYLLVEPKRFLLRSRSFIGTFCRDPRDEYEIRRDNITIPRSRARDMTSQSAEFSVCVCHISKLLAMFEADCRELRAYFANVRV